MCGCVDEPTRASQQRRRAWEVPEALPGAGGRPGAPQRSLKQRRRRPGGGAPAAGRGRRRRPARRPAAGRGARPGGALNAKRAQTRPADVATLIQQGMEVGDDVIPSAAFTPNGLTISWRTAGPVAQELSYTVRGRAGGGRGAVAAAGAGGRAWKGLAPRRAAAGARRGQEASRGGGGSWERAGAPLAHHPLAAQAAPLPGPRRSYDVKNPAGHPEDGRPHHT